MSPDLSEVLFCLGESMVPFTLRNACENIFISGSIGSGKSSGSGDTIANSYLSHGFGGLVLTVKSSDTADWERYARATGRERDLLIVRPDDGTAGHRFNFLDYEVTRHGRGSGITGNVVHVLTNALAPGVGSRLASNDRFWDEALRKLIHSAVDTVVLAGEQLTLRTIADVVLSAPHSEEEARSPSSLERSKCALLLRSAAQRTDLARPRRDDLEHTLSYWGSEFPRLAEKTRSVIEQSLSAMVDGLLRAPLRELLCTDSTFSPEDSFNGRIILLDMPIKEFGEAGRLAQLVIKTVWMHAVERRSIVGSPRPVFLWQDEAQRFLSPEDKTFAETARDRFAAIVSLTQSLSAFYSAMAAPEARAACDSYIACLNTKIFHFNEDPATCEFAERLFGKEERYRSSSSLSIEGRKPNQERDGPAVRRHIDFRREERPRVPAASLRTLRRGGKENNRQVDAIISLAGTFIRHTFVQEERHD